MYMNGTNLVKNEFLDIRKPIGGIIMPLTSNIKSNFAELYADNKKSGKEKGANGKPRSKAQIIAIALSAAKKKQDLKKRVK